MGLDGEMMAGFHDFISHIKDSFLKLESYLFLQELIYLYRLKAVHSASPFSP